MDHPALHASLEGSLLAGVEAEVALSHVSFDVIFVPLFLPSLAIQQLLQEAGDGQYG